MTDMIQMSDGLAEKVTESVMEVLHAKRERTVELALKAEYPIRDEDHFREVVRTGISVGAEYGADALKTVQEISNVIRTGLVMFMRFGMTQEEAEEKLWAGIEAKKAERIAAIGEEGA